MFLWFDLGVKKKGFSNILCESDSLQIVEGLQQPSVNRSSLGQLIEDIKSLALVVTEAPIIHVCRQANVGAHRLAHLRLLINQCVNGRSIPLVLLSTY